MTWHGCIGKEFPIYAICEICGLSSKEEDVDLSGNQKRQFRDALLDAFNRDSLEEMLEYELDVPLANIASTERPMPTIILEVIGWAERRGLTEELVQAAVKSNSTNKLLAAFAASLEILDS